MRKTGLVIIFFIVGLVNNSIAQLRMATPFRPQIFYGTDSKSIVYEIHLMDSLKRSIEFLDFEVSSENRILFHDSIYEAIPKKAEKNRYLKYMWIEFDQMPKVLTHKIKYKIGDNIYQFTKDLKIFSDSVITIGFPVKKGLWYMQSAPSAKSDHRLFTMSLKTKYDSLQNGFILGHCNQRSAIDFAKLGDSGFLYKHDGHKNTDHYCYADDAIAVSNGIVVGMIDSIYENNQPPEFDEIHNKVATGNLVMLDIGKGIIASYAHLIPGSIKVKVGDSLRKGDAIGKIGNSGNSTAPHLHFHLSKPDYQIVNVSNVFELFWLSEGISFVFDKYKKFEVTSGKFVDSDGKTEFISEPFIMRNPKDIEKSLPYENEIIGIK